MTRQKGCVSVSRDTGIIKRSFVLECEVELGASVDKCILATGEDHVLCTKEASKCRIYPRRMLACIKNTKILNLGALARLSISKHLPFSRIYSLNQRSLVIVFHKTRPRAAKNKNKNATDSLVVPGRQLSDDQLAAICSFFPRIPCDLQLGFSKDKDIETISSFSEIVLDCRKQIVSEYMFHSSLENGCVLVKKSK